MEKKKKAGGRKRVVLRFPEQAWSALQREADEFGIPLNKFIAVLLSHRKEIVQRIRTGDIVIL